MENTSIRLLSTNGLSRHYGGVIALSEVTMAVHPGQIFSLIGPNGAGKTTLFNCVTGLDKPTFGTVDYLGEPITGLRPDEVTGLGIGRTFQNIRLFAELTVLDNVKIGRHPRTVSAFIGAVFRTKQQQNEEEAIATRAHDMLEFVGLDDISDQTAGNLSYGDQRRVEIARALATEPKLLLLDEPAAGMNPQETQETHRPHLRDTRSGHHRTPHRTRRKIGHANLRLGDSPRPRRKNQRRDTDRRTERRTRH